mmetsp:Transcript_10506/g.11595  ORF Transcript_10506/g.11595 Transcript_10506/m.11595 type:complete len:512 (-) Transcript_10506:72-1607(-)
MSTDIPLLLATSNNGRFCSDVPVGITRKSRKLVFHRRRRRKHCYPATDATTNTSCHDFLRTLFFILACISYRLCHGVMAFVQPATLAMGFQKNPSNGLLYYDDDDGCDTGTGSLRVSQRHFTFCARSRSRARLNLSIDDDCEDDDDEECSIDNLDACLAEGNTEEECCIENLDACMAERELNNKTNNAANNEWSFNQESLKRFLSNPIIEVQLAILVVMSSFLVGLGTLQSIPPNVAVWSKNLQLIISVIFTVEYLLRWLQSGFSARYVIQPLAIIDLLAILPGIIKIVASLGVAVVPPDLLVADLINLRLLRILRLQRVLIDYETFTKFELALGLNPSAVRPYQLQLARIIISIFTLLSVTAGLIYSAEHVVNPDIPDYFTALYFTLTTLTTVGFGDISPVTTAGRWVVGGSILVGSVVVPAQAASLVEALLDRQGEDQGKKTAASAATSNNSATSTSLITDTSPGDVTSSTYFQSRIESLEEKVENTNARLDRILVLLEEKEDEKSNIT